MIDFPENLSNAAFDGMLKKGSVLQTQFLCYDGIPRPHYHIILNFDNCDDDLVYIISTSQLEFYNNNPGFNSDIVRIPENQLPFLQKESILNCRQVFSINKTIFKKRYSDGTLEFVGAMPMDILNSIDTIIKQSRFISPRIKRKILGSNNFNLSNSSMKK